MARFNAEIPNDIIKQIDSIEKNADKIFGEMTQAGADTVQSNMRATAPGELGKYVKVSRVYKTPSDDGINSKVYISGYLPFTPPRTKFSRGGGSGKAYSTTKGVPAEFLANLYEYGRSTSQFPKKPFFRKAFKKKQIEAAMMNVQNKYIK